MYLRSLPCGSGKDPLKSIHLVQHKKGSDFMRKKLIFVKISIWITLAVLIAGGSRLIITSPKVSSDIAFDLVAYPFDTTHSDGSVGIAYNWNPIELYVATAVVAFSRIVLGGIMLLLGSGGLLYLMLKKIQELAACYKIVNKKNLPTCPDMIIAENDESDKKTAPET